MKRISSLLVCALVAAAGFAAPATAGIVTARTSWIILPSETQTGEMTVHSGDAVLQSRVVPLELTTLDADLVVSDKNETLLRKGDQMFRLFTQGSARIFCSIHPRKGQVADILLIRIPDTYVCGIDQDADGKFESFYQLRTRNNTSLPVFTQAKTDGTALSQPVAYHRIDPRGFDDQYLFRIVYQGKPLFGKKPAFGVTFGPIKSPLPLTAREAVDLSGDSHKVRLARSEISLNTVDDAGAHISIDHGIPMQPFFLRIPSPRIIFIGY